MAGARTMRLGVLLIPMSAALAASTVITTAHSVSTRRSSGSSKRSGAPACRCKRCHTRIGQRAQEGRGGAGEGTHQSDAGPRVFVANALSKCGDDGVKHRPRRDAVRSRKLHIATHDAVGEVQRFPQRPVTVAAPERDNGCHYPSNEEGDNDQQHRCQEDGA